MRGADVVIEAVERAGVEYIFGHPGGAAMPIFDALWHSEETKFILTRHEQGATHMADGYARATGKPGVVLVTSGPGATNTITGLLTAHMDSVPMVVLTGQTPTEMLGKDAFQEADVFGISMPVVKHSYLVKDPNDIPRVMMEAFHIATTGRRGPVLVDVLPLLSIELTNRRFDGGLQLSPAIVAGGFARALLVRGPVIAEQQPTQRLAAVDSVLDVAPRPLLQYGTLEVRSIQCHAERPHPGLQNPLRPTRRRDDVPDVADADLDDLPFLRLPRLQLQNHDAFLVVQHQLRDSLQQIRDLLLRVLCASGRRAVAVHLQAHDTIAGNPAASVMVERLKLPVRHADEPMRA